MYGAVQSRREDDVFMLKNTANVFHVKSGYKKQACRQLLFMSRKEEEVQAVFLH